MPLVDKRGSTDGSEGRRQGFEPMLTAQEIAATLSVHPATARRSRVEGIGPAYFNIGPLHRYPVCKFERWVVPVVPA
jgi:hypothetical protein